mgnify:CR=1 FL=1
MIFETILTQAAQLAAEQEAKAQALKEQRRQEVYGAAFTPKRKGKNDVKPVNKLEPHREFIDHQKQIGASNKDIVGRLRVYFGVSASESTLSRFINGGKND